jgi:hypothetical protein
VTDSDLLSEAIAELYSSDLDDFTERRGALAASTRAAGQASVAKQIAGLRKPTRSAWVVNQLVHAEPDVPARLAALGEDLRAAENSMDGARLRELSLARRVLIEALVRQAFTRSGLPAPSAGLREEVTATLTAALADPQVAEQLRAGTLLRAARWDGFGSAAASTLTPVPVPLPAEGHRSRPVQAVPASRTRAPRSPAPDGPAPDGPASGGPASGAPSAAAAAAARAAAIQAAEQERRLAAIAAAEQAAAEADRAAEAAASAEQEQESAVELLEEQVAEARRRLSDASREARRTSIARRQARQALDRMRG